MGNRASSAAIGHGRAWLAALAATLPPATQQRRSWTSPRALTSKISCPRTDVISFIQVGTNTCRVAILTNLAMAAQTTGSSLFGDFFKSFQGIRKRQFLQSLLAEIARPVDCSSPGSFL